MVLVDSSVYIQLLRKEKNPVTELAAVFDITEMVICGVVCVEVLRGVVRPRVRTYLRRFFDILIARFTWPRATISEVAVSR